MINTKIIVAIVVVFAVAAFVCDVINVTIAVAVLIFIFFLDLLLSRALVVFWIF